jgi:Fur family ferric uptake transcriptional regulator
MNLSRRKISIIIRQRGYKLTPQRRAVLKTIMESRNHLTPEAIYRRVKEEYPGIGLTTVYRTLNILSDLRLICEVHTAGSCRSYLVRRPLEHHHHLICSKCNKVVDFTDCDLTDIERKLSEGTGFKIKDHLLEFVGVCPDCQRITGS